MIKKCIEKLLNRQLKTVETYSSIIEGAVANGNKELNEEYRHKLRGYLTCLVDNEAITEMELRSLYLWYACDRYSLKCR